MKVLLCHIKYFGHDPEHEKGAPEDSNIVKVHFKSLCFGDMISKGQDQRGNDRRRLFHGPRRK